jgi:hypothetical protein
MKFILVITICSSSLGICISPQPMFDNWYECSNQGYSFAYDFNKSMGKDRVKKRLLLIFLVKNLIQFNVVCHLEKR